MCTTDLAGEPIRTDNRRRSIVVMTNGIGAGVANP
jgi:hypothetical protein